MNRTLDDRQGQPTLHNIDFLRAIAAFSVLVWHYQAFYYQGAKPVSPGSSQPFYDQLSWLYTHGAHGVQLFWLLSGFVFFHVYKNKQDVGAYRFFVNRFSRLYPLHFITLNLVLLLQLLSWYLLDEYQVYPVNDLKHYFLNFFMASHWGFQEGWSFNAPIWSVSIEILVYVMFFAYLRTFRVSLWTSILWLLWSVLFFSMSTHSFSSVFACLLLFSLGGVVYMLGSFLSLTVSKVAHVFLASGALVFSILCLKLHWVNFESALFLMVFPSLVSVFSALEYSGISMGKSGSAMGSLTYATYLMHIPIIISTIIIVDVFFGVGRSLFDHPAAFLAYFFVVILVSIFTYRYVEMPLKSMSRARLISATSRPKLK